MEEDRYNAQHNFQMTGTDISGECRPKFMENEAHGQDLNCWCRHCWRRQHAANFESKNQRQNDELSTPVANDSQAHVEVIHSDDTLYDEKWTRELGAVVVSAQSYGSMAKYSSSRIEKGLETGSFLAVNLTSVMNQFHLWQEELPMVEPFYAVKCHPDPVIIRLLASLGCGFDCATMGEIDLVVNGLGDESNFGIAGKSSNMIVYANPAKMREHIQFAIDSKVRMTVFDGEDELHKFAAMDAGSKLDLLLRLTTDDKASICQFSKKFGCPVDEAPRLLEVAKSLGLNVVGVSFHVGSGCGDAAAYSTALSHTLRVFQAAEALGMEPMEVVDIGGGFPGDIGGYGGPGMPTFADLAAAIRAGIADFERDLNRTLGGVRFIAEPGRFFVSACTSVTTKIYARKGGANKLQALYVDDGVYGSFNNIVYDHANPIPQKLAISAVVDKTMTRSVESLAASTPAVSDDTTASAEPIPTAVFGPTCDGLDQMCSLDSTKLPRCEVGDWLYWDDMGAYTHTASFVFNGYTHIPKKTYCVL